MIHRTRLSKLAIAVAAIALGATPVLAAGSWSQVAPLNLARTAFAAATLADGSVLVAGGSPGALVGDTAERYDPGTNTWTNTGNLSVGRANHALVSLSDGGAIVTGGMGPSGFLQAVERFDAATSIWTPAAPMATARANHTATRLADGRVLVVGGTSAKGGATNEVEIYSPAIDAWTRADSIKNPRYNHTATLLADGRVLVAGGFTPGAFHTPTKKAEVYDPAADKWTIVGSMLEPRAVHAAVLLADGRVLVAGGVSSPPNVLTVTGGTEIWSPASASWTPTGSLAIPRRAFEAERLADGSVLVAGGFDPGALTATSERYDPTAGAWSSTVSLSTARAPALVQLADGRVLAIASIGGLRTTAVEAYTP